MVGKSIPVFKWAMSGPADRNASRDYFDQFPAGPYNPS